VAGVLLWGTIFGIDGSVICFAIFVSFVLAGAISCYIPYLVLFFHSSEFDASCHGRPTRNSTSTSTG
jgi:hypothetical protein